ncbi:HNH endonuclease [Streptomyces sp. NBC_01318]|uniref:HNH endonuclease signature motif containing protein n=1 Tax=Streptomyces sp. NBC_01318 TaxID=2903823 RepID=UPI002E146ADB|nr:HNH endonuclease [Streptomyces sp. NBC_01318]
MMLRIALGRRLYYDGQQYQQGDEIEVPDESAPGWLRTGLVLPAEPMDDAELLSLMGDQPGTPTAKPVASAVPAAKPGEYVPHEPCEPGAKPSGVKRPSLAVCPVVGCPCLTWKGKCRVHARSNSWGRKYGTGHRNMSADLRRKWEHTRRDYLRAHPYCECAECMAIPEPLRPKATEVDHIDGLGLLGPRAFDHDNLQSLTKSHHSRKTAGESFGR